MRRNHIRLGFGRTTKAVTALFAVVLVLVLGAIAASPSLHHRLHADSDRLDHSCIISAFANGQLSGTETVLVIITSCVFFACGVALGETTLTSHLDFYSYPNRAPPRL
jgi:hypothetical protein